MQTLLIVDDEPNIVEGLASQLQQRYGDQVLVLKAFSGMHALSILETTRVDVVLSDISMPDLDGITLAQKTEKLWPQIRFVFLSGFDDFDYIHRASKSSVYHGYLLKTEGDEVVLGKIDSELQACESENRAESEKHRMRAFLQRAALESTLRGGRSWREFVAQTAELALALDLTRPVTMVLGKCFASEQHDGMQSLRLMGDMLAAQAPTLSVEALLPEKGTITLLLQSHASMDEDAMNRYVYALFESIQQQLSDAYDTPVSMVLGRSGTFDTLVEQYSRLNGIYEMVARGSGRLMMVDERTYSELLLRQEERTAADTFRFSTFLHLLNRQLYAGSPESCQALFAEYLPPDTSLHSNQMISLFAVVLDFLRDKALGEQYGMQFSALLEEYLRGGTQPRTLNARLTALCATLCSQRAESEMHSTQNIISRIDRYIEEHIEDYNLSLAELARVMGFNPSYLSRLYRSSTGRKLSEQIDAVKLEHAKALIRSGQMIKNVAERTGFASPSAFILFFKRNTGKTPRQFCEENAGTMQQNSPR